MWLVFLRLGDRMVDWLIDWLIDWWLFDGIDWLINWLIDWLSVTNALPTGRQSDNGRPFWKPCCSAPLKLFYIHSVTDNPGINLTKWHCWDFFFISSRFPCTVRWPLRWLWILNDPVNNSIGNEISIPGKMEQNNLKGSSKNNFSLRYQEPGPLPPTCQPLDQNGAMLKAFSPAYRY